MGQSFFTIQCPHCKHETQGHAGGWGLLTPLDQVKRCEHGPCSQAFEVMRNSYKWVSMSMSGDSDEHEPREPELEPSNPSKDVSPELMKALLDHEAKQNANKGKVGAEKDEQLYVKRGRRYLPVVNSGPPLP